MKKLLSLFVLTILFFSLSAQKQTIFIDEDFSDSFLPDGWTIDEHPGNWMQNNTSEAGGTAPEARFYYYPSFTGISRLISPVIDLSGVTELVLSFKHFIDNYSGGITFGVGTTSDGINWNPVWTISPSNDVGPETIDLILNGVDIGSSTFQICFYFTGNSYNIDNWYIDDIQLFEANNLDFKTSSINNEEYTLNGDKTISITLQNVGYTNITSADFNYQLDNGAIVTESIGSVNLELNESYTFNFTQQQSFDAGDHVLKVWLENVNGLGDDDDLTNDTLMKTIYVASQAVDRKALYEEFTSSTCSPCANFNSTYFNQSFLGANEGSYTLIKYQMNWPSPGDPYYTDEGGVRRAFYGVSGVPTLYLDGGVGTFFDQSLLQNDLDNELAKSAFFEIDGEFSIDDNTITVDANIMPYVNASDFVVHIAVVEKQTTGNVGNNGETEFYNVMMKMLPDASGSVVNFVDGVNQNFNESFDLSSTFVEEMDDLSVVVFIQNEDTRYVFQSEYLPEEIYAPEVVFTPADGETDVAINSEITLNFNTPMRLVDDSEITNANISDFVTITDPNKVELPFTAVIDETKKEIVITPDADFDYNTEITVNLTGTEIENFADVAMNNDESVSFTTVQYISVNEFNKSKFNVYPNPATAKIVVECIAGSEIRILDLNGKIVFEDKTTQNSNTIDVSSLKQGVYIINVTNTDYNDTQKITIIR